MKKIESVSIDAIEIGKRLRRVDAFAVNALAESMKQLGQLQPISVYAPDNTAAHLVIGLHRLEAAKQLGWEEIDAIFVTGDEIDRALQEIAENLHRSELTALERSEQIAKWVELIERRRQAVQAEHPGRYERRGQALASKELGLSRPDVHRALKVSSLSPEAKQAARDAGLDDNRNALLIASKEAAKDQAPKILQIAHTKRGLASILSIQEGIKRNFEQISGGEQDTRKKKKKSRKPRGWAQPKSTAEERDESEFRGLQAFWEMAGDNARAAFVRETIKKEEKLLNPGSIHDVVAAIKCTMIEGLKRIPEDEHEDFFLFMDQQIDEVKLNFLKKVDAKNLDDWISEFSVQITFASTQLTKPENIELAHCLKQIVSDLESKTKDDQ
jgi:ParB/RepB/Spo0J family partition protein